MVLKGGVAEREAEAARGACGRLRADDDDAAQRRGAVSRMLRDALRG